VILSGGSGTRLWPLSTPDLPKQFVPLFGERSLFDLTLDRLEGLADVAPPIVVTGAAHVGLVQSALTRSGVGDAWVIIEPVGRNTAPATLAAALVADPEDVLVILPADHVITDPAGFRAALLRAAAHASNGRIVTFGVEPTSPHTGYGYIEVGASIEDAFQVERFKEKPDAAEAEHLASDGRHLWNSGMFVVGAAFLLEEAGAHCPQVIEGVTGALPEGKGTLIALDDSFESVEAISIDYAIMERTGNALAIPIDVGWDDVGSFRSLLAVTDRDEAGNHVTGDVLVEDVSGSFIRATSKRLAVAGVKEMVVVETPDGVLVLPLDRSQDVGEISKRVDRG
jgi:mannose-1-phosphate guanylyltransferase/mannose-6-phosphate isomerase